MESYIQKNRTAFDNAEPPAQLWDKVARALDSSDELERFIAEHRAFFDEALPNSNAWAVVNQAQNGQDSIEKFILENRQAFDLATPTEGAWHPIEAALNGQNRTLEGFLSKNRTGFDAETPDLRVWANIEKALPTAKQAAKTAEINSLRAVNNTHWGKRLMRAAAAITLLITCFGAGMWYAKGGAAVADGMALGEVSTEYAELETYYQRDIADKQQQLAQFTANSGTVHEDLVQLDVAMEELRKELATVPAANREQVVRAMIENYKAKTNILEKVLARILDQSLKSSPPEQSKNSDKHAIKNI